MRILLVEDDHMIGEAMQRALKKEAYAVDWVQDGQMAIDSLSIQDYGFILLDLGLPKKDGLSVLRHVRENAFSTPVIIVTARDAVDERISGLDYGADDYIIKPFAMSELLARIRAVVRRKSGHAQSVLSNGKIALDTRTRTASFEDATAVLSAKEYSLLHILLLNQGKIFPRPALEDHLYGWNEEVESNAVEYLIHAIRKKLGKESILNIRGVGWMVSKEN